MANQQNHSYCLVVGGGITGLIIATILQRKQVEVKVLDKGKGIGGRLATRRIQQGVFDYGAQYFSVKNNQFQSWVDEWLEAGIITEWCQQFSLEESQKTRYRGVISNRHIAKYLAQDLDVLTNTKVTTIKYDRRWLITTETRQNFSAEILIMTPPVPQILALFNESKLIIDQQVKTSLKKIDYYSCIAVLALLDQSSKISSPGGIVFDDHESLIWLADNYQKGISKDYAITLHATPQFSDKYWDSDDKTIAQLLFNAASNWLDNDSVIDYQIHRWRYSLPRTLYDRPYCALEEFPLVIAGDAFVAPKIEGAVLSGIAAADYILNIKI